jgi:tRNA-dihydrouridine synthase
MNYGFWKELKKPFFVLAPMADVTDVAFRHIIAQCGRPDVFYTEFVSCDGLCSAGRDRLIKDLAFTAEEGPIVAQFFGSKPENFFKCAQLAVELGFDGIDINMGCPAGKVVKQDAGIGLCKDPKLAQEIIAATQEGAGNLPVSVKTRLGILKPQLDTWIAKLLDMKLPALIIHGRTKAEMSKVPAHWDLIGEVAKMGHDVGTLVIGNGDVMGHQDGLTKAEQYGVDGLMVGRGVFHNPWIFNPDIDPATITPKQRLELLLDHTARFVKQWSDPVTGKSLKSFDVLKRFYKIYVSGWDGAKDLRVKLMEARNAETVDTIIRESGIL